MVKKVPKFLSAKSRVSLPQVGVAAVTAVALAVADTSFFSEGRLHCSKISKMQQRQVGQEVPDAYQVGTYSGYSYSYSLTVYYVCYVLAGLTDLLRYLLTTRR